jgi:opacity protein-like surface antigen
MRKLLMGVLMAATAATPVLAQDNDGGWRGRAHNGGEQRAEQRAERAEAREQRAEQPRAERQAERQQAYQARQAEQVQVQAQQAAQPQPAQQARSWQGRQGGGSWNRGGNDSGQRQALQQQFEASRRANEQVRADMPAHYQRNAVENERRYEQQTLRQQGYRGDRDGRRGNDRGSYRGNNYGGNDGYRSGNRDWNRNWRNDNRYDWQRYRSSNRNLYRYGQYYAPYRNYGYQRLSIGLILDSLFYSDRYWISDPWQYRLPPAPYGTRWVRYWDDALLVDVYTGEVVDVVYDFFY